MKVKCIESSAKNFDLSDVKTVFNRRYEYDVVIGDEYLVMGFRIDWDSSCIYYLINVSGIEAGWYPYLLFETVDDDIPSDWHGCSFHRRTKFVEDVRFICGFKELCDPQFYYNLVLGEEKEQRIYFRRKMELEEYYSEKDLQ
ncbi:MAG: hypothetical protein IKQ75_00455 [Bacteroidales bacterium]|nr:hypothetical protein [Bacteroidales bacterium]MBR6160319.1 hypothetical protein [Bacteroidales bacterium]